MRQRDRETLMFLLTDLIRAQDSVTHLNRLGSGHAQAIYELIAARNGVRNQIMTFVDSLIKREVPAPEDNKKGAAQP